MKKFWLPYSLWDMLGIELWLNELAAKGYELKKFSKFWYGRAEFQPSEESALGGDQTLPLPPGPHREGREGAAGTAGQLPGAGLALCGADRQFVRRLPL